MQELQFGNVRAKPGERSVGSLTVGELDQLSFARGQIELPLIVAKGRHDGPTMLLLGGLHSGEYVGMEAIIAVSERLDLEALRGAVVGIPVMNTYGFAAKVPYICPLDNLNMNRLWPGTSGGTVGQRITYAVWNQVMAHVDYLIDMHGGDFPEHQADYAISMATGDADLDATSEAMARHSGFAYIRRSPPHEGDAPTGPSAKMFMKLLRKPAIVSEVGDAGILDPQRMEQAVKGVENVLRLLSMLPGDAEPPPQDQRAMISRTPLLSPAHGICRLDVTIYDEVKQGQKVASIVDYCGAPVADLESPCNGVVVQTFYQSATNRGDIVMKIAEVEPA